MQRVNFRKSLRETLIGDRAFYAMVLSIVIPFYVLFLDVVFNAMYGNITIALRALR